MSKMFRRNVNVPGILLWTEKCPGGSFGQRRRNVTALGILLCGQAFRGGDYFRKAKKTARTMQAKAAM